MGVSAEWQNETVGNSNFTDVAVVIIGAGISGICTAIKLIDKKIGGFVIIEESSGFGGTWKDNRYPGCCCDVLSHLYSFSFQQNPDWSRLYASQEEILRYLSTVARDYDLYSHARFNTTVQKAQWDMALKKWKVSVRVLGGKEAEYGDKYTMTCDYLVSAVGQLNAPYYPDLPGSSEFLGKMMHSSRWDWSYDFSGKRIGIIGNGATAIQIAPEVAKTASQVTIFQRTANWIIPRLDTKVSSTKRTIYRHVPGVLGRLRGELMDGREAYFQALVRQGSKESEDLQIFCKDFMRRQLPDRQHLWDTQTPDYPPGCKRILISDDWYPTLCLSHVAVETRSIRRLSKSGILVGDADQIGLDLIVLATGFRTHDFLGSVDLVGREGRTLRDLWSSDGQARALYGVAVEDMPNLSLLYGPNTNLGHNSIILMIEAEARYISTLINEVVQARQTDGQGLSITPKSARILSYNEQLQKSLAGSSFADPRCKSWYKTDSGLVTNNWSGTVIEYQKLLSAVDWADYELVGTGAEKLAAKKTNIGRVVEETLINRRTMATVGLATVLLACTAMTTTRYGIAGTILEYCDRN